MRSPFLDQVQALTSANLKSRYRKTFAGFLWVVLNPLIMFGVQALVFSRVLRIQVDNYGLFLLSGLLPWIFMVQTLEMCTSIFVTAGPVLKSFRCDPMVYLVSQLLDNFVNFCAAFALVLIPLIVSGKIDSIGARISLLPLATLILLAGTFAMALLLANLQVFFRDTRFIVMFATGIAFFVTPVFYPRSFVPAGLLPLVELNPFYRLLEPFRVALYFHDFGMFLRSSAKGTLAALILLGLASWVWKRTRHAIYLHI
jgi:lipopolysaccharide transport system permease protein